MALSDKGQNIARWFILGLTVLSWIFIIVTLSDCSFMKDDSIGISGFEVSFGLFSGQAGGSSCEKYTSTGLDALGSAFKTGRAFGVLASLAISFAMVIIICFQVVTITNDKLKNMLWLALKVLFAIGLLCLLLTFVAFASDICDTISCGVGAASGLAIFNVFILIALCALSCMVPPPDKACVSCGGSSGDEETGGVKDSPEQAAGESTKVTITKRPDGSKVTTKEVTHPDGSKTITETVEE